MPKKSGLNVELASHANEPFLPSTYVEYTPQERGELRAFFEGDLWKKTLANMRMMRPPIFVLGLDGPLGNQIASNQLHRRQGWDLFEIALAKTILPGAPKKKALNETYPDEGRTDFNKSE